MFRSITTVVLLAGMCLPCAGQWDLVWSDEFDGKGLPDRNKWGYEEGMIRNLEAQYFTRERKKNVRQEDGMLIIEARKESYRNEAYEKNSADWWKAQKYAEYTSASLTTQGKADWTYGRIEVRAKMPMGRGMWPAFWTLGSDVNKIGWPACGEIDIMEYYGFDTNTIYGTVHTEAYNHKKASHKGGKITVPAPYESFHVYAVEWDKKEMSFFVDDQKYFSFTNEATGEDVWPFDKPHYLIINMAVGGKMGGQHGIDNDLLPQKLCVDYVRVFKKTGGVQANADAKAPGDAKKEDKAEKEER